MDSVGIERFSGVCSDSAGNTRKARQLLAEEIPGLLDLPDCCHHLHNTAKDITKLGEFKGVRTLTSRLRSRVLPSLSNTKYIVCLEPAEGRSILPKVDKGVQ